MDSFVECPRAHAPVLNLGGRAVDGLEPEALHGAAAVLVDEGAHPHLRRCYARRGDVGNCHVEVQQQVSSEPSEFAGNVSDLVDPGQRPWSGFSRRVAKAVEQRSGALATIIARSSRDA